jgi:sulfur-carrier protein adenylyltransferase/sulfurtransferase
VQEMKRALDRSDLNIRVVDVREKEERRIAHVPGTIHIPLSELVLRLGELDRGQTIYLHCKAGGRSMKALQLLRQNGFKQLKSVRGGLLAWAEEIERPVPQD